MWKECLRVLKPWWHLLSFAATRTYHRMASAIEDAGFEIRNLITRAYWSWFPKSLNISKQLEKQWYIEEAKEWNWRWTALKPAIEPTCMAMKPLEKWLWFAENCLKWGTGGINIDESRVGTGTGEKKEYIPNDKNNVYGKNMGGGEWDNSQGRFPANLLHDNSEEVRECFPETKSTPRTATIGGTGGVGVNTNFQRGSETSNYTDSGNASRFFKSIIYQAKASKSERNKGCEELEDRKISGMPDITMKIYADKAEREVLAKLFTEYLVKTDKEIADSYGFSPALIRMWRTGERIPNKETYYRLKSEFNIPNDLDYIYEIEQGERKSIIDSPTRKSANNHPTVKPVKLMEYLIKMVTPKGGIVLDPFAGSGSTLVAAKQNWYGYIGIEMTEEYIPIIEARLKVLFWV